MEDLLKNNEELGGIPPTMPSPLPLEGDITKFEKNAKKLGYIKKPTELTKAQKIIRTSLVSFAMMTIIFWVDWIKVSVVENLWMGSWEGFVSILKTTAVLFVQVVLAKIKAVYDENKE